MDMEVHLLYNGSILQQQRNDMTTINVTLQSRYNGWDLDVNNLEITSEVEDKLDEMVGKLSEYSHQFADSGGDVDVDMIDWSVVDELVKSDFGDVKVTHSIGDDS